jgi:hypothetical protein
MRISGVKRSRPERVPLTLPNADAMLAEMLSSLDTLEIAKRLQSAGFAETQAEALTAILTAILGDAHEADLSRLAIRDDHALLRSDFAAFKSSMQAEFAAFRAQVKADNAILRRDPTIRLGGMIVVATGILLAAKFLG